MSKKKISELDKLLLDVDESVKIKCVSACVNNSTVDGKELNCDTFINCLYVEVKDLSELIPHKTYIRYKIIYPDKEIYKVGGWFILKKNSNGTILVGNTPHSNQMDKTKGFTPHTYAIKSEYRNPSNGDKGQVILYRKLTDIELIKKITSLQIALDSRNEILKKN